ncbi:ABC transporter ATP-binding protein [Microbacterium terricola]|uniref:Multidrug ABC transporter ATP-binding protein n=1 Tax=Microbacterium terricola TaxID=344163 RepID=A0ABM8DVZ1_9MICO|nr:ABC transporter ATP-binding protein [Microbacterium terricola]UYK39440.1 ABC transporter ATP-binding protein [Microbacterium terricola]BDV29833.1 multidrug ABC transporter ATP-binding protein [Microbacterium terricola]
MTTPGIVVSGVRRAFGQVQAVRDVSLEAATGKVTGLVGPNGSGKTTLLLMLASLLAPDAGEIRLDGIDPVTEPQRARALLGWMPDSLGAWNALTARETLTVTGRLYDLPKEAARARAEVLLREVGLTALADSPARVLSRGQKQRLGLARALVHDPRILLLDEPASGLDPQARVELRVLLRRLADDGRTILISSHILSELEEVVDDAVFLFQGATVSTERVAEAAQRGRTWRLRLHSTAALDDQRAQVGAALSIQPHQIGADRRDLLVAFASDDDAVSALRALVTAGVPVAEFSAATGTLEHTFLDLGGGAA